MPTASQFAAGALISAATALGTPALAQAPAEHVSKYLSEARVAGEGRLTWFGFHVYDARLYGSSGFDPAAPFAQPFVLELTYARKLEGRAIATTSRDEIERMAFGSAEQRGRWFSRMAELFPNVDKGSRIAGVHLPGVGARFYIDGRFAGSIDEPEFAHAFFAIWLDPRTRAPKLREQLLGRGA
jgi:hypothetical protein